MTWLREDSSSSSSSAIRVRDTPDRPAQHDCNELRRTRIIECQPQSHPLRRNTLASVDPNTSVIFGNWRMINGMS